MPINVTVTLDSGSFLPMTEKYCEIGYFCCESSVSDIKIFTDGEETDDTPNPFKLCNAGRKSKIEVRHKDINNQTKKDGITPAKSFHSQLLHLNQLYGSDEAVEPTNFDCILRFDSGHFRASMVKNRDFKSHKKQPDGSLLRDMTVQAKPVGPIAHNMVVSFILEEGEALELARDDVMLWTSKGRKISDRLEIEITADNSTAVKFYRDALKDSNKPSYFLPNQGDPPPSCPFPPCPERNL
jgi:hypothetical protein